MFTKSTNFSLKTTPTTINIATIVATHKIILPNVLSNKPLFPENNFLMVSPPRKLSRLRGKATPQLQQTELFLTKFQTPTLFDSCFTILLFEST